MNKLIKLKNWYMCRVKDKHRWGPVEDYRVIASLYQFGKHEHLNWLQCERCGTVRCYEYRF